MSKREVDNSVMVSTKEAAKILGCGTTQVRTLAKLGEFRAFKLRKNLTFFRKEVENYLLSKQVRV